MRLPINLICRANKMNSDGTSTVFIQYCYNAAPKAMLHTGIKIPPTCWNNAQRRITNKLPSHQGHHEALNKELRRLFRIAEDLVSHAIEKKMPDKGGFVKKTFSPSLEVTTVEEQVNEVAKKEAEEKRSKLDLYY